MKSRSILKFVLCVALLSVLLVACENTKAQKSQSGKVNAAARKKGAENRAPDFTVTTLDGRQLSLSALRGKVVLLNFWASWCPPCLKELPHLERIYQKYKNQGALVVGMNVENNRSPEEIKKFVDNQGLNFPIAIASSEILSQYGISPIPHSFFIDKAGNIADQMKGYGRGAEVEMENKIRELLKK